MGHGMDKGYGMHREIGHGMMGHEMAPGSAGAGTPGSDATGPAK